MGQRKGDLTLAQFKVQHISEAKLLKGRMWPSLAAGQMCPSNEKMGGMDRNFCKVKGGLKDLQL